VGPLIYFHAQIPFTGDDDALARLSGSYYTLDGCSNPFTLQSMLLMLRLRLLTMKRRHWIDDHRA